MSLMFSHVKKCDEHVKANGMIKNDLDSFFRISLRSYCIQITPLTYLKQTVIALELKR